MKKQIAFRYYANNRLMEMLTERLDKNSMNTILKVKLYLNYT